jgi:hypothetical protein
MGVIDQRHAPTALYPAERTPGTHWIGGRVGLRSGLDRGRKLVEEKYFASVGDRTPVAQSVVRNYTD